jgi:hypothetical protein
MIDETFFSTHFYLHQVFLIEFRRRMFFLLDLTFHIDISTKPAARNMYICRSNNLTLQFRITGRSNNVTLQFRIKGRSNNVTLQFRIKGHSNNLTILSNMLFE